jgi:hypothetical protein
MARNTTHSGDTISLNNYKLLHFQNPFTMESGMSFFVELNVDPVSTGNSLGLSVYLVQKSKTTSFFQSNWLNNT